MAGSKAEVGRPAPDLRLLAATECRHAHERVEWKARTAPLLGVEVARAGTEHGNRRARSCSTDYIPPIRLRMVANCNGDTVPNARVVLNGPDANDPRSIVTSENGFFEFHDLRPGMTYQISISAKDSETWTSPAITIGSGQRCGNCFVVTAGLAAEVCSQSSWVYWRGI